MKKILKWLLKFLKWTLIVIVALVVTLPLWIGPVAKTVANSVVPKKTGTSFNMGEFALNPYTGKLHVGDVKLENPEGFSQRMALTLVDFTVAFETTSLLSDTVILNDVIVSDVFVSYIVNIKGENNFAIIGKNAQGEEEVKEECEQQKVSSQTAQIPQTAQDPQAESSKKVIIDHLLIKNVLVQVGPVTIPMPTIEVKDLGRASNGMTQEEAYKQISGLVLSTLNSTGEFARQLGNMGVDIANMGIDQVGKAADAIKNVKVEGMSDAVKGGAKVLGEGAGKAVDSANKGVEKAVDAIKDLF